MSEVIALYKPAGLTPLQTVRQYAIENGLGGRTGYAGRLDPLADGVLLGLFGWANSQQSELIGLDKHYTFTIMFGLTTDSYDLMGLPTIQTPSPKVNRADLLELADGLVGDFDQPYPVYSAVRVKGKPLFYWARKGKLSEIEIPSAHRQIFTLTLSEISSIDNRQLRDKIEHDIGVVEGDFRQAEIVAQWRNLLAEDVQINWPIATFEIYCSSGTYIRSLANYMGQQLGLGATTLSLTRTAVGKYRLVDCQRLEMST